MIVERTDFISVPVTDMERSKQFYRDTLGLDLIDERGFPEFQLGENVSLYLIDRTPVCHMAFFRDPDGNSLMLHRRHDA